MKDLESRIWQASWWLLIAGWVVLVARPGLGLGFLLDDFVGLHALGGDQSEFLSHTWWPGDGEIYRPLGFLFFWLEWTVTGERAWAMHGIHLALFGLAAWLTGKLASQACSMRSREFELAVIGLALLWPGRLEVALWIAALFDLLALVFVQLGLLLWLRSDSRRSAGFALAVVACAAALSKETGFVLSVIVIVLAFFEFGRENRRSTTRRLALVLLPQFAIFSLRFAALGGGIGGYEGRDAGSLVGGLAAVGELLFRALLMPIHPLRQGFEALAVVELVAACSVLIAVAISVRFRSRSFPVLVASVLICPLILVAPYLNPHQVVSDSRYLGISGCAIAAIFGCLALQSGRSRWLLPLLGLLWLGTAAVNLGPWLEAAQLREEIVSFVSAEVETGQSALVRIDGPIGRVDGAQALGSHVELMLARRLPDRQIRAESTEHIRARDLPQRGADGRPVLAIEVQIDDGQVRIERLPR